MGKSFNFVDVSGMMWRLTRKLLILLIVLFSVTEIQNSPVGGTVFSDAAHLNEYI